MHIYTHTHTHTHTHIYIHTHTHIYIYIYRHTHIYIYIHTHTHTHIYIYIHTHTHTHIYIYTHTHTHTHIYIYTHTHTYIHIYTLLGPKQGTCEVPIVFLVIIRARAGNLRGPYCFSRDSFSYLFFFFPNDCIFHCSQVTPGEKCYNLLSSLISTTRWHYY